MRKRILIAAGLAAALMGVSWLGAPSIGYAITITSITVTEADGTAFCDSTGACANKVWNLGGGVTISNGASLTLAQTGGLFNFDTSDECSPTCAAPSIITINGVDFSDTSQNLIAQNLDPLPRPTTFNEARDYAAASGALAGVSGVFTGYFDNVHTDPCADSNGNCLPEPFFGSATNTLIGAGALNPGIIETEPHHCPNSGSATCWDSGVIRIVSATQVAVPPTLILIGSGLMGFAAWGRRRKVNRTTA
jgi:hypothetical protein